jgi:hypothetical protein
VARNAGAGLLRDLPKMERIVKAVVDAVELPVTVKTRLGWDRSSIKIHEAAQMLEGRIVAGAIGTFFFALFVAMAIFVGRLAPALGPSADVAQLIVRSGAIAVAVIIWITLSLPVYRRRSAA